MAENTLNEITLTDAVAYTTAWRNAIVKPNVNSFLVPLTDLQGIVDEHVSLGAEHARVYLALVTENGQQVPKILFVGADVREQDILPTKNDPNNADSKVWDVVKPCPPMCNDTTSPLATGILS